MKKSPSPPPSLLARRVIGYLFGGFGAILLAGSILVFISWKPLGSPPAPSNLALAIVLVVVFIVQAGFNAWQDWSSSRVMASITSMLPENCLLLRDGNQTQGGLPRNLLLGSQLTQSTGLSTRCCSGRRAVYQSRQQAPSRRSIY